MKVNFIIKNKIKDNIKNIKINYNYFTKLNFIAINYALNISYFSILNIIIISKYLKYDFNYMYIKVILHISNLKYSKSNYRIQNFIIKLFNIIWQSELRSSNFNVKVYNFFNKWHNSALTTSFYDFLLKTKLLRDEVDFIKSYRKSLMKRYEAIKKVETLRYYELWKKYGLLKPLINNLQKTGHLWS